MTTSTDLDARELLAGRLVDGLTQAMEIFGVYLGVELGLYRALAASGAATEDELAGRAGIAARYAREWLEQQAVAGFLAVRRPVRPGGAAPLPAARRATPRCWSTPTARTTWRRWPWPWPAWPACSRRLLEAYRDRRRRALRRATARTLRDGIAAANRPMFLHELGQRLAAGGARPRTSGCRLGTARAGAGPGLRPGGVVGGAGAAYPRATVLGVDLDEASVAAARAAAAAAGVADRVSFEVGDAARPRPGGAVRPGHHLRGAPRHGRPGRGAAAPPGSCWPTAAASWSPTSGSPTPSPPPATRPSGSCTAGASCTACRPPWPRTRRGHRHRRCGPPTLAGWAAAAGFADVDVAAPSTTRSGASTGSGSKERHGMMLDQEVTISYEQPGPLTVGTVQVTAVCDVTGDFPAPAGAGLSPGRGGRLGALAAAPPGGVRRARPLAAARLVLRGPGPRPGRAGRHRGRRARGARRHLDRDPGAAAGRSWPRPGSSLDEIDLVVLTHLHLDHIGWNLAWDGDRARPLFPRARYLVQRADWELFAAAARGRPGGLRPVRGPAPGPRGGRAAGGRPHPGRRAQPAPHPRAHPRLPEPAGPLGRGGGPALGRRRQPPGPGRRARLGPGQRRPARGGQRDQAPAPGPARDRGHVAGPGPLPGAVRHRDPGRRRPPLDRPA